MRVDEISTISLATPGGSLGQFKMPDEDVLFKVIGRVQGLTLIVVELDSFESTAVLIDTENHNEIAGKFSLAKYSELANSWITSYSRLGKNYTGRKLAPKVYAKLVQAGYTLVSDSSQSPGGMKIWRDLIQEPGVFVYAFLIDSNGEFKYSQVSRLEQRAGDASFAIYDREYEQEMADLEELFDAYQDIEYNSDTPEVEREHAAEQRYRVGVAIQKLRQLQSHQSRGARLIATARQKNVREAAGVGTITAQNHTADVGPNEIKKQAAKFGNSVDRNGRPPVIYKKSQRRANSANK